MLKASRTKDIPPRQELPTPPKSNKSNRQRVREMSKCDTDDPAGAVKGDAEGGATEDCVPTMFVREDDSDSWRRHALPER